jgi:putative membrane protein
LAGERTNVAKFRTALALDRTTLAWIRTALTFASFGFGMVGFFRATVQATQTEQAVRLHQAAIHMGVALIVIGLASLSMNVLGQYVLAREQWRTDETGGTWVKIPLWVGYSGPGLAVVSIAVSLVSNNVALLLWLLLPLRDLFFTLRASPGSSSINNP